MRDRFSIRNALLEMATFALALFVGTLLFGGSLRLAIATAAVSPLAVMAVNARLRLFTRLGFFDKRRDEPRSEDPNDLDKPTP